MLPRRDRRKFNEFPTIGTRSFPLAAPSRRRESMPTWCIERDDVPALVHGSIATVHQRPPWEDVALPKARHEWLRGRMRTSTAVEAVSVELLTASDWVQLRQVRLRALRCDPDALGTALTDYLRLSPLDWQHTLTRDVWMFAARGAAVVGVVAFFPEDTDPDGAPQLGSMWVDPSARGRGLARRLCAAVVERARAGRADTLGLWVIDGNSTAAAVYGRLGFHATGHSRPAPRDNRVLMRRMTMALTSPTAEGQ